MANCKICGKELKENEKCMNCYPEENVFRLKRKFSPIYDSVVVVENIIIVIITLILVLSVLRFEFTNMTNAIFIFITIVAMVVSIILYKKFMDANEIMFYEDRFEKKIKLNKTYKKVVKYDDIVDVLYIQNFYQRMFNTACISIKVKTQKDFFTKTIKINNVRNVETIYNEIVKIIKNSRTEA